MSRPSSRLAGRCEQMVYVRGGEQQANGGLQEQSMVGIVLATVLTSHLHIKVSVLIHESPSSRTYLTARQFPTSRSPSSRW